MTVRERIKDLLRKDSLVYSKPDNLFLFLSTATHKSVDYVKSEVEKMLASGEIYELRKGKYIVLPSYGFLHGKYMGSAKGYGFCSNGTEEDIFIPANRTKGAIDGDEVIVKLFSSAGKEGEVLQIVKKVEKVVGKAVKISKNFFLQPDNSKIPFKFPIMKTGLTPRENDKVVAKLVRRSNGKISCEIIEILGQSDDVKSLELSIIREHNLYEQFPSEAEKLANKLNKPVTESQKKGRVDLTKIVTFTIDGEDAKDFDDAVSIKMEGENYLLGVHIADVGEFVKRGTILDDVAFERGTSTYFPTSVLPMLPVGISNGICSLNEGVERLTLSCMMTITPEGEVIDHKIFESVIKSRARLTYTEVYALMQGKDSSQKAKKCQKEILLMARLAKILENKRTLRGALDLDIPESQFLFDEEGYVTGVQKRERNDAHKLIEEFMVVANETVAKHFAKEKIPFVYRVHEKPTFEKIKASIDILTALGLSCPPVPKDITPKYLQSLLELLKGKPFEEATNKILLRSLQKALYRNQNLGHFGLALEYYCHFTSPIRRYPDLAIHRIIKAYLHKKLTKSALEELEVFTEDASIQSSMTERNSEKAEREVDDLWLAYLMKDHVGEVFDAKVTSVMNYGIFVGLENSVEGLIRLEDLPVDSYLYFEKMNTLKGQKHIFKIGDSLKVRLSNVNLITRKVDFVLEK